MGTIRVLVVEDEPHIAESLSFVLERAGFHVEVLGDGAEVFDRLRGASFGAMILDIMLPGANGLDLLRAIRADRALSALPVVVLTAKGQANDRRSAEEIGASAFITKPFANSEVVESVSRLVDA